MQWMPRRKRRPGTLRGADAADAEHLTAFVRTRQGVEAYLEPRTSVTETTLVLIASSGEWTRRRVAGAEGAAAFAKKHALPLYEAEVVGYPDRMRRWNARRRAAGD